MADAYTDTTTVIAFFTIALMASCVAGLIVAALMRCARAAYMATLMELVDRRQGRRQKR